MAARATGWDVLSSRLKTRSSSSEPEPEPSARALVEGGVKDVEETIERERVRALSEDGGEAELRQRTRWNLRKALRYRSSGDVKRFGDKVQEHMVRLCPHNSPGPAHAQGAQGAQTPPQSYQSSH
jgi:hypothetical protein